MYRSIDTPTLLQAPKTSEPRFKRLAYITAHRQTASTVQRHTVNTAQHSPNTIPPLHSSNAFDSSKENLLFEGHLQKVRSACKLDETTIVGKYLGTIRKDYDTMAKDTATNLATLRLRQKEIEFLKSRNKGMAQQRQLVQKVIAHQEVEVAGMRQKWQDAAMQTKILQNMIARMRKDQVYFKQLRRLRDEEIHRKAKQQKLLEETLIHEQEKIQKLQDSLNECKVAYSKNQEVRYKKFQDYSSRIEDVKERDEFLQQRRQRTYQLQSIQLNDTLDEKNIRMRQITLAHKLADSLLESKVAKLIQSNSHIQEAFHLVKAKTAITEPQLLTAKFFSYEQTAETLLQTIAEHENRMEELTAQKTALSINYQTLLDEGLAIADAKDSIQDSHRITRNDKQGCLKVINENELLTDKILHWVDRCLLLFHSEKAIKSMSFQQKFRELCTSVSQAAKRYDSIDWRMKKIHQQPPKKKRGKETSGEESLSHSRQSSAEENDPLEYDLIQSSFQSIIKKGFSIKHFKRESGFPSK